MINFRVQSHVAYSYQAGFQPVFNDEVAVCAALAGRVERQRVVAGLVRLDHQIYRSAEQVASGLAHQKPVVVRRVLLLK